MVPTHRPAATALAVLERSTDAVVATDAEGRVVVWNRAAERLLGYRADQVMGRPCHDVLDGIDLCGNRFCRKECELTRMVRRRESVRQLEMSVRAASGERIAAAFSILAVPGSSPDEFTIVHLFRPVGRGEAGERQHRGVSESGAQIAPSVQLSLTPREHEILGRLDEGAGTREIAAALHITGATVRTHIQHILRKLEVHSRLEAVTLALRARGQ